MIAAQLDDKTLLAFVTKLRTLRSKALFVFGDRFFGILKFFLHPMSLQALTDIANTPYLASHVHTLAFGTEILGTIDPIHDEDVKRQASVHSVNAGSSRPLKPLEDSKFTLDGFELARYRVDSRTISDALQNLPKLKLIMIGKYLRLQGRPVRPSWGISTISRYTRPSRHCGVRALSEKIDVAFRTVLPALNKQVSVIMSNFALASDAKTGGTSWRMGWN